MEKTKINISLDAKLEERFRKTVYQRKGMKKGNLSEAFEEALERWIKEQKEIDSG